MVTKLVQSLPIEALVVSAHPLVRAGIRFMLDDDSDIHIIAETENAVDAQRLVQELSPRVALVSAELCASALAKTISENTANVAMLVIAENVNDFLLTKMLESGAVGYIRASDTREQLIAAIQRAARGEILFSGEEMTRVRRWQQTNLSKWDSLTQREKQVIWMLVKGLSNQKLSDALGITYKTTAVYVTSILDKLEVRSRQEAITWVFQCFNPEALNDLPNMASN